LSVIAGAGWGDNTDRAGTPIKVPTYYANSPSGLRLSTNCFDSTGAPITIPATAALTCDSGTPLRKFVDSLPVLPGSALATANAKGVTAGKSLGVAIKEDPAKTPTYADADYYEIAVVEYRQQLHTDLPATGSTLRGYVQIWTPNLPGIAAKTPLYYVNQANDPTWLETAHPVLDNKGQPVYTVGKPQYLGPSIMSAAGRPVRVKFANYLPTGRYDPVTGTRGGDVFLPTDETVPGSGFGPDGVTKYTQNRTNIHLHGGDSPWISDGGPHTWITPAGENTPYKRGVGALNVPDMPDPGEGATTYFWPNNQSARQMWYHDHSFGSTRIDVTAGIVSGFFITDAAEQAMITAGTLPGEFTPLVYEDKTFVPKDIAAQDAKWDTKAWGTYGDIWMPHVYETNQDPNSIDGTNGVGRWDYGPWFWPVFPAPLALPAGGYGDASGVQEMFNDTSVVNGVAYPDLAVDPKTYRFRFLNASTSRYVNLGLYIAEPLTVALMNGGSGYDPLVPPKVTISDPQATAVAVVDPTGTVVAINVTLAPNAAFTTVPAVSIEPPPPLPLNPPAGTPAPVPAVLAASINTEVALVPAVPDLQPDAVAAGWARDTFDGRVGGIPVYAQRGPDINVIGNEGGFLPGIVKISSTPVSYEQNRRSVTVLNVLEHGLYVGPAERTDLLIDFSAFAGKTLIMYNDAPAPNPGFDPRNDYFVGQADYTGTGGGESTLPGFGPNTRSVMRFTVSKATPDAALDVAKLDTAIKTAYAATQDKPIVPQAFFNDVFPGSGYTDNLAKIYVGSAAQPTMPVNTSVTAADVLKGNGQKVTGFIVESQGYDYTVPPTVVFSGGLGVDATGATIGTHATATAVLDNLGQRLLEVRIDTPGNYISAPTVSLVKSKTSGPKDNGIGAAVIPIMSKTDLRPVQNKGIQELFDPNYGRMNATFSVELPFTSVLTQTTIPVGYVDPVTEFIADGETQIWKITHNGVDAHPVHFHLFNVQVVNRVGWDGTLKEIDPTERGWKETVKMNPLEDIYIAVKPKTPLMPFGIPNSIRPLDPSQPIGATAGFSGVDPFTGLATTVTNTMANFGWEYVWHCHILGHEENDFMRPMVYDFKTAMPLAVAAPTVAASVVSWIDPTPPTLVSGKVIGTTLGNKANEIGFIVQRNDGQGWLPKVPRTPPSGIDLQTNMAPDDALALQKATTLANVQSWTDSVAPVTGTQYRVVGFNSAGYSIAQEPGSLAATVTAATDPNAAASNAVTISSFGLAAGTVTPIADVAGVFSIPLVWTAGGSPSGFKIARTGGIDSAGVALAAVTFPATGSFASTVTTFTDTTATQGSAFQYSITALDTNGRPGTSTSFAVQTDFATPAAMPSAPAAAVVDKAIVVSWAAPAGTTPITGYRVVRTDVTTGAASLGATSTFVVSGSMNPLNGTVVAPATSFADSTFTAGNSYTYTVQAVNGPKVGAASPASATVTASLAFQTATAALVAANDPLQVKVTWQLAAGANVTSFQVTRTGGTGGPLPLPVVNASAGQSSYSQVDPNTQPLTTYTYTVQALNGTAKVAAITTFPLDTGWYNLAAPTNLSASYAVVGAARTVNLSWVDNAKAETGYQVERAPVTIDPITGATSIGTFTTLATGTTPNQTSYADSLTAAQANTQYAYRVTPMFNGTAGKPATTQVFTGTLAAVTWGNAAATLVSNTTTAIAVKWTGGSLAGRTGLQLQVSSDLGVTWTSNGGVLAPNATTATATGLSSGTSYLFRVQSLNSVIGASATTTSANSVSLATQPAAPTGLAFSIDAATSNRVALTWTAVTGATSYRVYNNGVLVTGATGSPATNATTIAVAAASSNSFTVAAVGAGGTGAQTATGVAVLGAPAGVTRLNGIANGPITAGLNWTPVAATTYNVMYGTAAQVTAGTGMTVNGIATGTQIAVPAATTNMKVQAVTSTGVGGAWSASTAVTAR
jgi:FtsP/CotA-like multicopper oxidase with cupredoxin domain